MIEIEFEPPSTHLCHCCGNEVVNLTRFVHWDGDAYAVYYAQYGLGHDTERLIGMIGLGKWGDGFGPEDRVAFAFEIWTDEENFNVALVDSSATPWSDVELLGRRLTREEALVHRWRSEVFHITDHIVQEDHAVRSFFERSKDIDDPRPN